MSRSAPPARRRTDRAAPGWRDWDRLVRPLARDDHRARFWKRHVQIGVVLTELTVISVSVYVLLGHRPHAAAILAVMGTCVLLAPVVLLVPIEQWSFDHRGALLFYFWSLATTAAICTGALLDGGATSPLLWLLVLALTYAALAYPPLGVASIGAIIVSSYLLVCLSGTAPGAAVLLKATVLAIFTAMTTWASRNQWDLVDQQHLLTERLATLADTDGLTSCLNRRAFHQRVERNLRVPRQGESLSLCLLDLDNFKRVNDAEGHAAGDRVLLAVARTLLAAVRETDAVGRLGGDEFAVLLLNTGPEAALAAAGRLQRLIEAAVQDSGVTASVGVSTAAAGRDADALIAAADERMYLAKTSGGNRARA